MTHPLNHRKTRSASLIGAAVLALGMLAPVVASADSNDRVRLSVKASTLPVAHNYRDSHRYDRVSRSGYDSRYFVRPHKPLNFKHWLRVERALHAYTPNVHRLNRYEVRQVLGHGYDRYLRDHRRWSQRATLRSIRNDHRRDRWVARHDVHDRNRKDRSDNHNHNHNHNRRW